MNTDTEFPIAAAPVSGAAIPAPHFQWFLAAHAVFASMASIVLVFQSGTDEPYWDFQAAEALSQVGLGCVLMWLYLIVGTLYGVASSRLPKSWLLLLLWAAIVLFYLRFCPLGYVEDISGTFRYLQRLRQ